MARRPPGCARWSHAAVSIAKLHQFHFVPAVLSVGVLVSITVLFGGLAIRRLARKG